MGLFSGLFGGGSSSSSSSSSGSSASSLGSEAYRSASKKDTGDYVRFKHKDSGKKDGKSSSRSGSR